MQGSLATVATPESDIVLVASDAVPLRRKSNVVRVRSQSKYIAKMKAVPVASPAHGMRKACPCPDCPASRLQVRFSCNYRSRFWLAAASNGGVVVLTNVRHKATAALKAVAANYGSKV